jgi:hypothetical protein
MNQDHYICIDLWLPAKQKFLLRYLPEQSIKIIILGDYGPTIIFGTYLEGEVFILYGHLSVEPWML